MEIVRKKIVKAEFHDFLYIDGYYLSITVILSRTEKEELIDY
jgi:hypothetical protein